MAGASPDSTGDAVAVPVEFAQALRELGLADAGERLVGAPLAGGVSSDIWRIDTARGTVCAIRPALLGLDRPSARSRSA